MVSFKTYPRFALCVGRISIALIFTSRGFAVAITRGRRRWIGGVRRL